MRLTRFWRLAAVIGLHLYRLCPNFVDLIYTKRLEPLHLSVTRAVAIYAKNFGVTLREFAIENVCYLVSSVFFNERRNCWPRTRQPRSNRTQLDKAIHHHATHWGVS